MTHRLHAIAKGEEVPAEINLFLGEGVGHIKLIVDDPLGYDDQGNPYAMPRDPAALIGIYKSLVEAAQAENITLGKDAPRRGGYARVLNGTPPEAQAPEGVEPPMHCGQPCEYKDAWLNRKTGKTINPKYVCRAGDACTDKALTGYPWSVFADRWVKAQGGAV